MFIFNVIFMMGLSFLVLIIFNVISVVMEEDEYLCVYECGFDSVKEVRSWFSYRFFLLGILFIVFDVEVSLLLSLPYSLVGVLMSVLFFLFIFVLLMGIIYEIEWGSMEWV